MDKKERILEAAQKIFSRFGVKKTTMDEIARLARMGKATIYYYFRSKEEIFSAVIRKESALIKNILNKELAKIDSPQEKFRTYIITRMLHLKKLSNYYTTLTDEYLEHYSFVEKERADFTDFEIRTIRNILEQGVREEVFDIEDPDLTARMIVTGMKGLEYPLIAENESPEEMENQINRMLKILFRGLEKR